MFDTGLLLRLWVELVLFLLYMLLKVLTERTWPLVNWWAEPLKAPHPSPILGMDLLLMFPQRGHCEGRGLERAMWCWDPLDGMQDQARSPWRPLCKLWRFRWAVWQSMGLQPPRSSQEWKSPRFLIRPPTHLESLTLLLSPRPPSGGQFQIPSRKLRACKPANEQ